MIVRSELEVPNEAALVRLVRHHAAEPLRQLGIVDEDVVRVETIVSEACTNIVRHGWKEGRHWHRVILTSAICNAFSAWLVRRYRLAGTEGIGRTV